MIEYPPSTGIAVPGTKSDADEARKTAIPAKSSMAPQRATGVGPRNRAVRPAIPLVACLDAGIVDEDGDAAEFAWTASGDVGDRFHVGDVGRDGERLGAALLNLRDRSRRLGLVAAHHRDRRAGVCKAPGHAEPDAAI